MTQERPLTAGQLRTLREMLEERARRLRRELDEALQSSERENPHEATDDDAVADVEADEKLAFAQRDARELNAIAAALARIDAGTYGECIGCGEPIAWARLRANPETLRCLECATAAERRPGGASL